MCLASRATAYTLIVARTGDEPVWPSMPVRFWINDKGSPEIANGSEFAAVQSGFQTWQSVPTASVSVQYMGTTPIPTVGLDGFNVITFVDDTVPLGSDTIAATFSFFETDATGSLVIQEADIALGTSIDFSTSADSAKYDIQSVVTHEAGHFLGLDHAALLSSVMTPFGAAGQLDQRTLTYDDMAGISELYPNLSAIASLGAISGTILSGQTPVFGAHVVALDANGTPLVSAVSNPDGTFQILFLPAGSYRIYAEPLDGPVTEQNIGGTSSSFYFNLNTGFGTTYAGDVSDLSAALPVQVFAGRSTAGVAIHVLSATALNLTVPGNFAPRIPLGSQGTLTVGGTSIVSGDSFSVSGAGLTFGSPTYGGQIASNAPTSARISLSIATNAATGPKNIAVTRTGASSVLSGGIVITNLPPANIRVSPSSGSTDGGTITSISGQNFAAGAHVYFGGVAASNVQVTNSTLIQATAPPNSGGPMNVVVVNGDGTWGVQSGAFTYVAQPPQITSVSPLIGPTGTIVTITGTHFSARSSDVQVLFNGTQATLVTTTPSQISAVVPFGATTGPITVTVFGQVATGPGFTVTPTSPTTNLAPASPRFVDLSSANGGTALVFGNNDDAAALVDLPFPLTFFKKTYAPGSKIAVATNGWMSLDAATNPEYENAPLPASTVQHPGGGTGSIPSALIAPFFDDLFLKPDSSIIVQTLDSAPNRRFVVEWWNAGILDEQSNDVGAALIFEAILYETSNDIQFIYKTASGPRSDASSATVGMQDSTRTQAVLTGYNQSVVSAGQSFTYHFMNGAYGPPATVPPVTDWRYTIGNRGGISLITDGSSPGAAVGYATIQRDAGNASPSGVAIFGYRINNVLVTEAGVPASRAFQAGRIYAEVAGPVNTGLAIANPNNGPATISFSFTDSNGTDFGSGTTSIPANSQIARFLDQPPFSAGSNIHGTFTFSSDVPVSVIAIRGLTNERGDFLISTLPVLDTSAAVANTTVILPHFADGGGWTTQVILVNPTDAAMSGNVRFLDPNGQVLTLGANSQELSTFAFSIPRRSSYKLMTSGAGSSVQTGSVQVVPANGSATPVSFSIFSNKRSGVTASEAAVVSVSGDAFRMYVEASGVQGAIGSIQTGFAIANSSPDPASVNFELTGLDGTSLANGSLTLPGNGQSARFLRDVLSSLPQSVKGILRITSSTSAITALALRARYNERGDFLMTTTPPVNEATPGSATPVLFPHIVSGGGFTTQFVLFGSTGSQGLSGDLRFVNQDSTPLSLNVSAN
jgi:hypothetical protein